MIKTIVSLLISLLILAAIIAVAVVAFPLFLAFLVSTPFIVIICYKLDKGK